MLSAALLALSGCNDGFTHDVVAIGASGTVVAALKRDGSLSRWGYEVHDETVGGFFAPETVPIPALVNLQPTTPVPDAVGFVAHQLCLRESGGGISCGSWWGDFFDDVLDVSSSDFFDQHCLVRVSGSVECRGDFTGHAAWQQIATGYKRVSVGYSHACAIGQDATLSCWDLASRPVALWSTAGVDLTNVLDIASAPFDRQQSVALTGTGELWSLSATGSPDTVAVRQLEAPGEPITKLAGGFGAAGTLFKAGVCGLSASGSVFCWEWGETTPIRVSGIPLPATDIAGTFEFMCALLTDETVWCWVDDYPPSRLREN